MHVHCSVAPVFFTRSWPADAPVPLVYILPPKEEAPGH